MKESKPFGRQIIKGSAWIIALEFSNQVLQFIKTFYAAKILSPVDFGIVGFAFLIIAVLDVLSTTGMKEAIIQRKDNVQSYLSTVWVIELAKGVVVLVGSLFLAPLIIHWAKPANPELIENVIRFIGLLYFVLCSTNIGVVYFEKNIEFNRFFLYQFSGTLTDVIVSLVLVYYLQNVWALFYGIMAGTVVRVLFSFLLINFRPKLEFDYHKARELLKYGKWIFKGRIFTFLGMQLDSIVASTFFSLYAFGIYQMAYRIGNLPMNQVANVMGRVIFPTFSKVHDDLEKVKSYFLASLNVIAVCLAPIVILIFCFIPEFTVLLLGEKWILIVPVVRVLVMAGFLRIFATVVEYFFMSTGEPKTSSNLQTYRFILFLIFIGPLGYFWGLAGLALAGLFAIFTVTVFYLRKACFQLNIRGSEIVESLLQPLIFATLVTLFVFCLKSVVNTDTISKFLLINSLVVAFYFIMGLLLNRYTRIKLFEKTISFFKIYKSKV